MCNTHSINKHHTYAHKHIHTLTNTHINAHTHTHTHTQTHTLTHTYIYILLHVTLLPCTGCYFGTHFIMGGQRFDTVQPEIYLFGENNDLNFLGNRPSQVN